MYIKASISSWICRRLRRINQGLLKIYLYSKFWFFEYLGDIHFLTIAGICTIRSVRRIIRFKKNSLFKRRLPGCSRFSFCKKIINPLNPELNPICYLLALLRAHHFLRVSRIRVKSLNFKRLMSYIYGAPILDVSRSHTTTQHSR